MKWRTVLCTALFLCGTVLLSACGGGEMPAPAEPSASSEVSAPSQPEEVPAPSAVSYTHLTLPTKRIV